MASKIEKEMSVPGNVFDCPICLEQMKTPKYLPCLHTFCEICLNAYIETSKESTNKASKTDFACPICRKSVKPPNQDLPVKDWAKNFPDNYLILTLMEKSGDYSENCAACWRQNRTSKSSFWCVSCAHPVCTECKNVHVMFNALKNHRIITLEEFRNQDIFPDIEYYCDQHSGKTVEVVCVDHTKLCCSVCFATKHRSCHNVRSLEDISEKRNPKEDDILLEKLRELIQETNQMEKEFQKMKQNLQQESEAIVENVTQEVEKTKKLLAKKLEEFIFSHERDAQEKIKDIENIQMAIDGFKKTANESFKILSAVMKGSSQKQRFLVSHQIRQLSNQTLQKILELPSDVVAGYTYPTEKICQDVVEQFTLKRAKSTRKPIQRIQSLVNKLKDLKSNENINPTTTEHQQSNETEITYFKEKCKVTEKESEEDVEWINEKRVEKFEEKNNYNVSVTGQKEEKYYEENYKSDTEKCSRSWKLDQRWEESEKPCSKKIEDKKRNRYVSSEKVSKYDEREAREELREYPTPYVSIFGGLKRGKE